VSESRSSNCRTFVVENCCTSGFLITMLKSPLDSSPDGVKPTAGESFPLFTAEVNSAGSCGALPDTWSKCDPASFNLRVGPDYSKNKRKEPSVGSLLEIVGVE
jgi:hypothetical protein